jgi:hydrogenase expression/formation protein HypE
MRQLIRDFVLPRLGNDVLRELGDAAALTSCTNRLALTTDSFVVSPLFFPGGDIGKLAIFGTVNDLAVAGAMPRWVSLALIIEEGFDLSVLGRILESVAAAAGEVGIKIVAGDTKVLPVGAVDGLYINTTGVGELLPPVPLGPAALSVGDSILVTGPIGQHGMAVLTSREFLGFDPLPQSDCGSLLAATAALRTAGVPIRCMRDATRGGIAAVLHEWADASQLTMAIEEQRIPVTPEVRGACELLGLDPVHVANEGTMLIAVPEGAVDDALLALGSVPVSASSCCIGQVRPAGAAPVVVRRAMGKELALDEPLGAPLPRIC